MALLRKFGLKAIYYDAGGTDPAEQTFGPKQARKHGLIVYSPGFNLEHPWLCIARAAGCICLSELDLAALSWPHSIIGITGTNGKTTLTEFLAAALRRKGLSATAVGNNGVPFSMLVQQQQATGIAVCEISSFQAESVKHLRLDALLWTHFSEDHLDRHRDLHSYFAAKWRLLGCLRQRQFFLGPSVAEAAQRYGFALPDYAVVVDEQAGNAGTFIHDTVFARPPQRANGLIAHAYWRSRGLDEQAFCQAARGFSLPRHRLALTTTIGGIAFWNDSKATNFSATLAALESFASPVLWIGGGKAKGGDLKAFLCALAAKIKMAFLFGATAPQLAEQLELAGRQAWAFPSLTAAVQAAFRQAEPQEAVLFSPGFASQDGFCNYAERGEFFEKAVLDLKKSAIRL